MDDATAPAAILEAAAYRVAGPDEPSVVTPVICASPHSGRIYPLAMMAASQLDRRAIRRSEDAHVDELIAGAPAFGHTLIAAEFARAFIDVNREPWELDPAMFEDELPAFAKARTARVAAGLGAIARIVCEGQEIYARKLTFAEAEDRVRQVHQPYHAALAALIAETKARTGLAILIDWHSMPAAAAAGRGGEPCDFVLGDRFGSACSSAVAGLVERELGAMGYRVARNAPYAGGYTTEHYGRPGRKVHALQIEISRALYFNERELQLTAGFPALQRDLERLFAALAAQDWAGL
ncbi:MAG TPA: N-formylglutamate amidohydrolase [Caulobacteraceae bacterium]|nr:N-formylglutamate amidohydrolase [Caulobacteraceae bacterium]